MRTSTLGAIDPAVPQSWQRKVFVTFDIDWAHDAVLAECIDAAEQLSRAATWFVTHDTPLLARLRANPLFELAIHPNFNFLMQGDARNGATAAEVVKRLMEIVPEAKCVRSHSLTQSSHLSDLFRDMGLTHECNVYVPPSSGIRLVPWRHWNGLVKVPHCWEDDVEMMDDMEASVTQPTLGDPLAVRVFDFHPIHVFLNTENLARYERCRPVHRDPERLKAFRFGGFGAHSALVQLSTRLGQEGPQ